ncbi:MAG: DUF418 domain-containing protein [Burkholderiaceae bacterium]|nr:DUF418 domain-containing protein [Burkholderiaceae bacterium]
MPRPLGERLPTLDILRGFALMGILIMNMPGFGELPFAKADGSHLWPGAIDQAAEQLRDLLFSGKFKSMFSLLFGLGLTIQFQRMLDLDPAGAPAMGLAHASLLWTGDVLHLYALLGTVLPLMLLLGLRWVSDRGIVWLIGACLSIRWPPAWCGWRWSAPSSRRGRVKEAQALEASNNLANGQGSYSDTVLENPRVMAYDCLDLWSLWVTFGGAVTLALTMLIGVLAGRRRWVQRVPELMPQLRRLTWWSLAVGIACGAAFTVIFELNRALGPSLIKTLGGLCHSLPRLALMIFYVAVIVRLAHTAAGRRWLAPFEAAGRMPLTNDLMQGLVCITLFRGWGFGRWMQVGAGGRPGTVAGDLLRGAGAVEPVVAEAPRARAGGGAERRARTPGRGGLAVRAQAGPAGGRQRRHRRARAAPADTDAEEVRAAQQPRHLPRRGLLLQRLALDMGVVVQAHGLHRHRNVQPGRGEQRGAALGMTGDLAALLDGGRHAHGGQVVLQAGDGHLHRQRGAAQAVDPGLRPAQHRGRLLGQRQRHPGVVGAVARGEVDRLVHEVIDAATRRRGAAAARGRGRAARRAGRARRCRSPRRAARRRAGCAARNRRRRSTRCARRARTAPRRAAWQRRPSARRLRAGAGPSRRWVGAATRRSGAPRRTAAWAAVPVAAVRR